MKQFTHCIAVAAALAFALIPQVQADTNIAQGKTVTAYGTYGTGNDAWTAITPALASTLTDGMFVPEGTQWDFGSLWWNGGDHPNNYITIDLAGQFTVSSLTMQADNNDAYPVLYKNGAADTWHSLATIPGIGGWGLMTRSASLTTPVTATVFMIGNASGDSYYSVSEFQAFGQPVPEPETYAMLLAGLGLLGVLTQRRQRDS